MVRFMNKRKHQKSQIEGVTQRRRRRSVGDFSDPTPMAATESDTENNKHLGFNQRDTKKPIASDIGSIADATRSPVDESAVSVSSRRAKRQAKRLVKQQKRAEQHAFWRIFRRVALVSGLAMVLLVGVIGLKSWLALQQIIDRGGEGAIALQENIDPSQLNGEGDGRVNILLIGIGGEEHTAGNLADSIIVVSIDPFSKEMGMLSIPRDMYVTIPGFYQSRINAAHSLGSTQEDPNGGIAVLGQTIEETLDIPLHYYARVDFQGFVQAVDNVGGITIELEERVFDPNFGDETLDLPAGPVQLDGETALRLARARGAIGGLGVSRGDFGRADQQRKMLLALKDKVLSAGTFANPTKIAGLIDTVGNHARTDLQVADMLRLYEIIESIPEENIVSYGLDNGADNYLTSANIAGAAVLIPKAGVGNYTQIQEFVRELFVDGFIKQEQPIVDILNGSEVAGVATEQARELRTYGYTVPVVANAPEGDYNGTVVYDLSNGEKPFTKRLLEQRFQTTMLSGSSLPDSIVTTSDFVVIIGNDTTEIN